MQNNSFKEIWEKLKNSRKILMSLHSGPDGDSCGSCLAMKCVLEKLEKYVRIISKDPASDAFMEMSYSKEIEFNVDITEINLKDFDILLCLDTSTKEMIGQYKKWYKIPKEIFIINMDHHPTNTFYGNLNYVNSEQPSTCSILLELLKFVRFNFDKELSTRLLLGICTDSGFFTFKNSAEKALKQASFLIQNGGEYEEKVLFPVLSDQPLKLKKYYALQIMKLRINKEMNFAYSITTAEEIKRLKLNKADVRLGPNDLQYIKEFDFIFTLAELEDEIKGSFRSQKGIDVSLFAKELGGGGHKSAAAFILPKMNLGEAEKLVLEAIKKVGIHFQK